MWLKERPFLGSPGGFACGAFTARAVSDQLRKVAYGAPSDCCPAGSRLGSPGKSGERPAAQGRPLAPRAIAALRERGSGARARAVSAQLRKVAYGAPSDCCPAGSQLGSPGKSGATSCARSRNGAPSDCCPAGSQLGSPGKSGARPAAQGRVWRPEQLLPCGIAARVPGQERCATSCARSRMAPRAIAALRDRGSGARARAVRPAAQGRVWRPERLLPCVIAAREPGQER
ncbi:hypothetical protein BK125_18470 [Paenibacillus odorifer]|nr:hypothetical protein BK125_18470 [Paenibacillus odorifer]